MGKLNGIMLTLALMAALCGTASATQLYVDENGWQRDGGAFNASGTSIQEAVDKMVSDVLILGVAGILGTLAKEGERKKENKRDHKTKKCPSQGTKSNSTSYYLLYFLCPVRTEKS